MLKIISNPAALKRFEKKHGKVDSSDILYDKFDNDVAEKLENFEPLDGGFDPLESQIKKGWIFSKNKRTRVWWKGIGQEFYNNWNHIIA